MKLLVASWVLALGACAACTVGQMEHARELLQAADTNRDGQLSREEIEATGKSWAWWWDLALLLTGATAAKVVGKRKPEGGR